MPKEAELFAEDIEEEKDIFNEEEQRLNELGFDIFIAQAWYKRNPDLNIITKKGTININFFKWYLKSCDIKELNMLRKHYDQLSGKIQILLDEAQPVETTLQEVHTELMKNELEDTKGNLEEHYRELYEKYKGYLEGLYKIMVEKTELFDRSAFEQEMTLQREQSEHPKIVYLDQIPRILELCTPDLTEDEQYLLLKIEEALGK